MCCVTPVFTHISTSSQFWLSHAARQQVPQAVETRIAAPFPPRASYSSARQRACSSQPMIFLSDSLLDYSRPTMISVISRPSSPVCGCSRLSADWPICRRVSLLRRGRHIRPQHRPTGTNDATQVVPSYRIGQVDLASRGRFGAPRRYVRMSDCQTCCQ
jgi:hypothetical protein